MVNISNHNAAVAVALGKAISFRGKKLADVSGIGNGALGYVAFGNNQFANYSAIIANGKFS